MPTLAFTDAVLFDEEEVMLEELFNVLKQVDLLEPTDVEIAFQLLTDISHNKGQNSASTSPIEDQETSFNLCTL